MKAEKRTENLVGSSLPLTIKELPVHEKGSDKQIAADVTAPGLSSDAFTTFFTWRGNGVVPKLIFNHSRINANSRVFVSSVSSTLMLE
ncbi:MAG TPA: hypothetical protein VFM05_08100 [Candidatus Saccharimonadales bacterium]|nr:hypothetical protein [Candidatus Saccharimonadales bacterium]